MNKIQSGGSSRNKLSDLSVLAQQTLPLDTLLYVPMEEEIKVCKYREWLRTEFCAANRCFFTRADAESVWVKEHDNCPYDKE